MKGIIRLTKFHPKRVIEKYKNLMIYADLKTDYTRFLNFIIIFGLGVSVGFGAFLTVFLNAPITYTPFIALAIYGLFHLLFYLWLTIKADGKGREIEKVLPDALQLMAMNLKAGMTTERAILLAARPEFGAFEQELSKVTKQVLAGADIKEALTDMTKRIKSEKFERTISLLVEGMNAGGELSDLLNQSAEDIRNQKIIEGEIQANVMMYAIFIFFATAVGAPMLYSISTFLVGVLGEQFSRFSVSQTVSTGISFFQGSISLKNEFLLMYALLSLTITAFFSSMIIGIIKSGKEKDGLKLFPVILLCSFIVFGAVRFFVSGLFTAF